MMDASTIAQEPLAIPRRAVIRSRSAILETDSTALFRETAKAGVGHQMVTIEQIRLNTPQLATIDGSWTVTGARDKNGKELPPVNRRGLNSLRRKMDTGAL